MSASVVRSVRLPEALWRHYQIRADELNFPSIQPLILEALEFYSEKILGDMERSGPTELV
jgi:hypothetical protein